MNKRLNIFLFLISRKDLKSWENSVELEQKKRNKGQWNKISFLYFRYLNMLLSVITDIIIQSHMSKFKF